MPLAPRVRRGRARNARSITRSRVGAARCAGRAVHEGVRLLLEDLCERRKGHRNVLEEEVQQAMALMDKDGNGGLRRRPHR